MNSTEDYYDPDEQLEMQRDRNHDIAYEYYDDKPCHNCGSKSRVILIDGPTRLHKCTACKIILKGGN